MSALHVHVEQHKHYPAYIVYVTQTKKWQNCKANAQVKIMCMNVSLHSSIPPSLCTRKKAKKTLANESESPAIYSTTA
jgi:hypothetical protein